MTEQNGSTKSPAKVVAHNMTELAHDIVTLSELQTELVKSELSQWLRGMVVPACLLVASLCLFLGCVPILLLSLAFFLFSIAGLPPGWSLLISVAVGFVPAALAGIIGARNLPNPWQELRLSRRELARNVKWIKHVLKSRANPLGFEGDEPEHQHHPTAGR